MSNINEKVEQIYTNNIKILNFLICREIEDEIHKLSNILLMNKEASHKLRMLIFGELTQRNKRLIEHKIVIDELYPNEIKEETLKRLPQYIRELR